MKRAGGPLESGFPGGPYKDAEITHSHPEISNAVFLDAQQLPARKSTLLPEDSCASGIHVAEFQSAAVPKDVAIHQNPVGARLGASLGLGKVAHRKFILPRLGIKFHKPGVGTDKGVALTIRLDGRGPGDGLECA